MRVQQSFSTTKNWTYLFAVVVAFLSTVYGRTSHAWDVDVYMDRLEDYFYVDFFSGSYTWTTVREGVRADSGDGSIPNNYIWQDWDGSAWPSDSLYDADSFISEVYVEHYDGTEDEYFDYAEAYIYGDVDPGRAIGAAWAYEFDLTIDPGNFANVYLGSSGAYAYIESEAGDDGFAFANIKLYSPDIPLDEPGGVNNPFAQDPQSLVAPPSGGVVDAPIELSYMFTNYTDSPMTYRLRLEGTVSVFENGSAPLAGDGNGDGWVDGLDYLLWAGNFGTHPGSDGDVSDGDYNDDGWVDGLDYLLWAGNFGGHASETASVPEPGALGLIFAGGLTSTLRRRRREV
ncbi:MAG: PEP-CTERM sorting domain-containing protein [Planctomycetales bacterium]|nr:PEP-CTERM sorting domain-containing protein [Planctomycetales bacterium]